MKPTEDIHFKLHPSLCYIYACFGLPSCVCQLTNSVQNLHHHLQMDWSIVQQPVGFKSMSILSMMNFQNESNLEQAHVKKELEQCVNRDVEVNIHWHPTRPHVVASFESINFLSANHCENEEQIGCKCDDLGVHHRDGHPVIAPQESTFSSEFTELLREVKSWFITPQTQIGKDFQTFMIVSRAYMLTSFPCFEASCNLYTNHVQGIQ